MRKFRNRRAQTLLDYILLLGIVSTVLFAMNTSIRRSIQAVVKGAADHIGRQEESDQDFEGRSGFLVESVTDARTTRNRQTSDFLGALDYNVDETTTIKTNSLTNLGVVERAD